MGNWQLDPYHTQVEFSAKHFGMMTVRGHFAEVATTADIDPGRPETSSVEATIQAASIRTNNQTRDDDLRSANFLDTGKYPVITFRPTHLTGNVDLSAPGPVTVDGIINLHGKDHPLQLSINLHRDGSALHRRPTVQGASR